MTGRDLIIYILQNGLEDEPVFENGKFVGFVSIGEAASSIDVGIETMRVIIDMYGIDRININGRTYLPFDYKKLIDRS